jgi:hypothetical protein
VIMAEVEGMDRRTDLVACNKETEKVGHYAIFLHGTAECEVRED